MGSTVLGVETHFAGEPGPALGRTETRQGSGLLWPLWLKPLETGKVGPGQGGKPDWSACLLLLPPPLPPDTGHLYKVPARPFLV
jgi:hypothetical protein